MLTRTAERVAFALGAASLLAITGCDETAEPEPESAAVETGTSVAADTAASGSAPPKEAYMGPRINAPQVEPCPFHEEVSSAVDGPSETQAMVDKAIELGCEPGPHGEIDFEEPLFSSDDGELLGLISVEHAMSVEEMCDAGYIPEDDCVIERERAEELGTPFDE